MNYTSSVWLVDTAIRASYSLTHGDELLGISVHSFSPLAPLLGGQLLHSWGEGARKIVQDGSRVVLVPGLVIGVGGGGRGRERREREREEEGRGMGCQLCMQPIEQTIRDTEVLLPKINPDGCE